MRVLFLDHHTDWSGGQQQVYLVAKGLLDRGHEVHFASPSHAALPAALPDAGHCRAAMRNDADVFSLLRIRRYCLRNGIRLLHGQTGRGCLFAALVKRTTRGRHALGHRRVDGPPGTNLVNRWLYRNPRAIDRWLYESSAVRERLRQYGTSADRLAFVPSVADADAYREQDRGEVRQALAAELELPLDRPWIGITARMHTHKGIQIALTAAAALRDTGRDFNLLLVGDGPHRAMFEEQARELSLTDRTRFLGFRRDIPRLQTALDIFLYPSFAEALGSALIEASMAGCALIASNVGGIPDIVRDGSTGWLVPPRDPDALAAAMTEALDDNEKRATYAAAAQARAQAEFHPAAAVDASLAVYESLLAE